MTKHGHDDPRPGDPEWESRKVRLIAKLEQGDPKAAKRLVKVLIREADPAELNQSTRSPAMAALIQADAFSELFSYVWRMKDLLGDQPDLLADLGMFAGMYTELNAHEFWHEAADLGSSRAMRYLSAFYSEMDEPKWAIRWLKRAAAAGDEEAPLALATLLKEEGRSKGAVNWEERAALAGWPQALNSRLWDLMISGEHQAAVDLFDRARDACERRATEGPELEEHWSTTYERSSLQHLWGSARSQDALHRLALGGAAESALAVWQDEQLQDDLGSRVHGAILKLREGSPTAGRAAASRLGRRERRLARAMLSQGLDGSDWFREWSQDGLDLLASTTAASASYEVGAGANAPDPLAGAAAYMQATIRGVLVPDTLPWFSPEAGHGYPAFREELEIAAEGGDLVAVERLAHLLDVEGWESESAEWWERAALAGSPRALGSLTWYHLLRGNHRAGVEAFDRARPACEARLKALIHTTHDADQLKEQWLNARSNDALNRLALGGPTDAALAVWAEGVEIEHAESLICPAILAMREGRERDSYYAVLRLASDQREAARTALGQGASAEGWFGVWCRDGIRMIDGCPPDDAGTVRIELTGEEACTLRAFIHKRFDGLYCGPRGLIEEVDLQLGAESVPAPPAVPIINSYFDPDTGEVQRVELPDEIAQTAIGARPSSIRLALTDHEASLLHTLTYSKMSVGGAGRILSEVTRKLHDADAAYGGLDLRLNDNRRLEMDSFEMGAKPSSLPHRNTSGN